MNVERNFYQREFLSYQKTISPKILQLSANDFWVRTEGGKQHLYKKLKIKIKIRYFNIVNIAECWCEIAYTFEGSAINQR